MILKSSSNTDVLKARNYLDKLISKDCRFELKEIKETRSSLQNSALHLFFSFVSTELNELGMTFKYDGLNIKGLESRYTTTIIKEFIWRPIQISMFDIQSTKKINTTQINEIVDVIIKYFGDRGVNLEFPSIETLIKSKK